jgi:hypothetical protein
MRKLIFLAVQLFFITNIFAQSSSIPAVDKSPMDMSTYPPNYPLLKAQDKASEPLIARVIYSRPTKNNRVIFGDLVEYNKVWRFGANENTEVEFYRDVKIKNTKIKKGRYSIFAVPTATKWTIILNKDLNTWGSFRYEASKDVARFDVPTQNSNELAEAFYIYFDKATGSNGFTCNVGWDDVKTSFTINY